MLRWIAILILLAVMVAAMEFIYREAGGEFLSKVIFLVTITIAVAVSGIARVIYLNRK